MREGINELQTFQDNRGKIYFNNDIDFSNFNRMYIIDHPEKFKRAWQYHVKDEKLFIVQKGEFEISWVFPKNVKDPEKELDVHKEILNENDKKVIYLPNNCANSVKSLKKDSKLIVFSKLRIEEALNEKIRFPSNYW